MSGVLPYPLPQTSSWKRHRKQINAVISFRITLIARTVVVLQYRFSSRRCSRVWVIRDTDRVHRLSPQEAPQVTLSETRSGVSVPMQRYDASAIENEQDLYPSTTQKGGEAIFPSQELAKSGAPSTKPSIEQLMREGDLDSIFERIDASKGCDRKQISDLVLLLLCAEKGEMQMAMKVVQRMKRDGADMTVEVYNACLIGCLRTKDLEKAKQVLGEMSLLGVTRDAETDDLVRQIYLDRLKRHCSKELELEYMEYEQALEKAGRTPSREALEVMEAFRKRREKEREQNQSLKDATLIADRLRHGLSIIQKARKLQERGQVSRIWQLNLMGSKRALDMAVQMMEEKGVRVLLVSDPPKCLREEECPVGYRLVGSRSCESRAMIVLHEEIELMKEMENTGDRVSAAVISLEGYSMGVASVYISYYPKDATSQIQSLQCLLRDWTQAETKSWLLGGDFNAESTLWGPPSVKRNPQGRRIEQWITDASLSVVNDPNSGPTFCRGSYKSWLDLSILSEDGKQAFHGWRLIEISEDLTDHQILETTFRFPPASINDGFEITLNSEVKDDINRKASVDEPANTRRGNKLPAELTSLPSLAAMARSDCPIKSIFDLWLKGSESHRPLKHVYAAPLEGHCRWGSNNIARQTSWNMRNISIVVELIMKEGYDEDEAIRRLEEYANEAGLKLRTLASRIFAELNVNGVSRPRKHLTSDLIYGSDAYRDGTFFWRAL